MGTGFFLLDNRNPNGDHFYPTSRGPKLAAVIHITAGLEDLDTVDDHSAENTARYASTTDREVSWHGGSDTDSFLYLLPPRSTAWHVVNYNTHTYGWEISKRITDWGAMSQEWVDKTLRKAAAGLRPVLRELGIPIRRASRAELDRAIASGGAPVGLVSHAELQPEDRTDPGLVRGVDTFPWERFLRLLNEEDDAVDVNDVKLLLSAEVMSQVDPVTELPTDKLPFASLAWGVKYGKHYAEKSLWVGLRNEALLTEVLAHLRGEQVTNEGIAAALQPGLLANLNSLVGSVVATKLEEWDGIELSAEAREEFASDVVRMIGGLLATVATGVEAADV